MKTLVPFAFLLMLSVLVGCTTTSEETIEPAPTTGTAPISGTTTVGTTPPVSTTSPAGLLQGMFMSNVHATSGTVNVVETGGKRTLVFTNFRTDGGPDLRIYLAENTGLRNFIEVSRLTSTSGNFSVELPAGADPARQRYVIIWCKAFSVLFGNAELK
ncbi:DM13 domain-containing protein [Spirosoma arcticum]